MKKPLFDGFTREIIAVSFDKNGNRVERDFDLMPDEEKISIRKSSNRKAMLSAGYRPVTEQVAAR
ncbi:MAG: hypothetical protein IKZ01_01285 [Anaerotignum sp.]|nr:hypothetical protein [Anaerotignum sp.]MBR5121931.1 hypothetical protein [Anaerotignum sp.]